MLQTIEATDAIRRAGFVVHGTALLQALTTALITTQGLWFAIEPWSQDAYWITVKPESLPTLRQLIKARTAPATLAYEARIRAAATTDPHVREGELEINENAAVSHTPQEMHNGAYVQAWLWVEAPGCRECGGRMTADDTGVTHHLTDDGETDPEADADHTPVFDIEA